MLFSCTVGQLVNHLQATLAVNTHIPLETLWEAASRHTHTTVLDGFQKNVVWRALLAVPGDPLVEIYARNQPVPFDRELSYGALLRLGSEAEITLRPSEPCQFRYLTNTADYAMLKTSLGEHPFALLVVIARHGAEGVLNADLAREAGQDIRLLRLRLIKLEQAALVVCRNVYVNKKHTTCSVHVRFAGGLAAASAQDDADNSLDATRDVARLRRAVVAALQSAPNHLRGFSDLRKELRLDGSRLASKFFRSVCLKMHRQGIVEKLHVELPATRQRVYAIQLVADAPAQAAAPDDLELPEIDDPAAFGDSDVDSDSPDHAVEHTFPVLNRIFPVFHQIFQQVAASERRGVTAGEVNKALVGTADYRPFARLFELLPSYLSNLKNLKPFKKYAEPYDDYSIIKLYENEGKLRFYKYFAMPFCSEEKPAPKPYSFVSKPTKLLLTALQKKLHVAPSKVSNDSLRAKKRRLTLLDRAPEPLPTPQKRPRRVDSKKASILPEPPAQLLSHIKPQAESTTQASTLSPASDKTSPARSSGEKAAPVAMPEIDSPPFPSMKPNSQAASAKPARNRRRERHQLTASQAEGSLKAISRRDHILDIIREEGGATFKSASLCRKLDERLGLATKTDSKTLNRDITHLTESGVLESQKVLVDFEGKQVEKRVLVLKDPLQRPTAEVMESLKAKYVEHMSKKNMKIFERRLIQSEMKLYVEKPNTTMVSPVTRMRRGKGRLATLGEEGYEEPEVEDEDEKPQTSRRSQTSKKNEDLDILERIKRAKRPRKATIASVPSSGPRRTRRNIKIERSGATIVYRSVVISKTFSKDAIDFDAIASFLEDIDGALLRQKWGTLRRLFGGAEAVSKGVETFQNMVLQGVEDGHIMEEDLLEGDLRFFLDFWTKFDKTTEFAVIDEMPLWSTFEKNTDEYTFKRGLVENTSSLSERLEYQSMRQKEFALGQQVFTCEANLTPSTKPEDDVKSILKSIFTTGDGNFDPIMVKTVLGRFGDEAVRSATNAALRDKEIQYLAFDDSPKFVLGEQFKNALVNRQFNSKLFHQAALFKETLNDISAVGKGLILSQGIQPGEIACLLELISDGLVDMTRIDRTFKFENYESRLVDKEQIGCDIVVQVDYQKAKSILPITARVPIKAACQPVWVDLNAHINKELWIKTIISLLAHVVFRPGITDFLVHEKMQAVLSYSDYCSAMGWLVQSGCVQKSDSGGYLATNCWSYILGHYRK
ncbi:hypothetical protein METBIDRAFT_39267 [Metschnikowia bicuspidata var. bicuspidata NRRL YB-4993]|uniref:Uncharacterized protein n=1 Tax=Metschnikowia bicuspidata var. bicuspidata NRRL YB-4993 TaxID=869754 RepID=A0A1A0HDN9_9ASCO|nr:hypothetical protein METBIDRAFT_39267 [Metschnikowia bicuspidata var. bicuspidata NRRL YB-4993]OBA22012.1 hypothetical protein METBIDRAFT_39267 [Metschnikowia bicuspidata var. bicuspidata NRRL YB-4993]